MTNQSQFRPQSGTEQLFNRTFGFFVGLGIAPSYAYLLQVRGRKSGKVYSTPVSLLELNGKNYLVAPRGRTQWVRNAEVAGEIALKKGSKVARFRLRTLSSTEKLPVLKAYLDRFHTAVQRFFTVKAGSPAEEFAATAENYPAFELLAV
jgi:hypothetical protein